MKSFLVEKINAKVRYHDLMGDKTPILFLHGLGCSSSFDYPQVASSESLRQHRIILIDLLGSGFSDKPDGFSYSIPDHVLYLKDLIEHLNINEFYLYGHSMGGSIAISLAEKCGSVVKGIIVSEANLDSGGGFFSKKIAAHTENDYATFGHADIIKGDINESNGDWAPSLKSSSAVAIHREAKSLVDGEKPSWREKLFSLKVPRTFIFGEKSLPNSKLPKLEKKGINIEIVKNAGHSMPWDNPKGLAAAIQNGLV